MSVGEGIFYQMPVGVSWCQSVLGGVSRCQVMSGGVSRC